MTTQDFEQAKLILDDVEQAVIQSINEENIYVLGDCLKKHGFKNSLFTGYFTNGNFELNFNYVAYCILLISLSKGTYKLINDINEKVPKTEYYSRFEQKIKLLMLMEYMNVKGLHEYDNN